MVKEFEPVRCVQLVLANSDGTLWQVSPKVSGKPRKDACPLTPYPGADGTPTVNVALLASPRKKPIQAAAIILLAFTKDFCLGDTITYLDGDPTNLALSNLSYHPAPPSTVVARASSRRWGTNVKLTADDVRLLRAMKDEGYTGPELAKEFDISLVQVYNIVNRNSWRDV